VETSVKALVIREHGDLHVLRFEERPDPVPRADEVVVRVRAIGVNNLDTWVRRGVPGHTFPLPIVPGSDAAGTVVAAGSAAGGSIKEGDEVVLSPGVSCRACHECLAGREPLCRHYGILGESRDGTCAELIAVPGVGALPRPASLSREEAAAVPLVFLTAWHMLRARAVLSPGEWVLIRAAGSGVGSAALQIAKMLGATVIAEARTTRKCSAARGLGADYTIDSSEQDTLAEVRRITGKRGVDVVVEHVGEATWESSVRSLTKGGRLVTCGATTGADARINLRLLFFKNLSLLGSTMGGAAELMEVLGHVAAGRLRPVVDRVLPFDQAAEAHRLLADRAVFGKIVLTVP
jgi:NADPH:quinone reductase-like Zn-dependent oxidoreductase